MADSTFSVCFYLFAAFESISGSFVSNCSKRAVAFQIALKCFPFLTQDPYGVAVGGTFGHSLCTGLAVIGGRMIAQKISVRTGKSWAGKENHQFANRKGK